MALTDEIDLQIASYALGVLEIEERAEVEAILAQSPEIGDRLEWWRGQLAALDIKLDPVQPPAAVWVGISQRLGFVTSGIRSTFSDEGSWIARKAGIEIKYLEVNPGDVARTALLRMAADAILEPHLHASTERCFIVEGEVTIGESVFRKGDYHIAPVGTVHQELRARTPALILLHWA